ncbi:MAG: 23S rRNA (adenine(2030)-N(6))-methyltransferase RlmJ [Micavibrio aeruginosavorus]|uniref:Ribosomal RNA large subunit methyltransferase J n=1 Tax=Micavibrio aeruginosavorus TaxID=349221 RepID=A0A2W5FS04_9BACT|nr:MAG: 23S rRNA (adenine(2030)-N(6))-methyltransferase RlmJ [Micavibrio aeruginosavorus]
MNYRHIYHAGNFADIFKHLILNMTLGYLQNKEKGLFALDAFAGCGLYALNSEQAQKTREYSEGAGAFMNIDFSNPDLAGFQAILKPYWEQSTYPGSPLLIADKLRDQDRLLANELHPEDLQTLKKTLYGFKNVKTLHIDAYDSIRGAIPPVEKRGVILIDPPFERKDEFQTLARQMPEWMKRWATGCYMIWYPIKAESSMHEIFDAALGLENAHRIWISEFLMHPRNRRDSFNGCGVMMINTPFQIPERVDALSASLCTALHGHEISSQWLKED